MALVYLHLDRCKGTPKWRMRKSLKQNGVREERREGWRQKGKMSFPSRRPTGLLSKLPTDGFCHELNEVTRGETTQAKRARGTSSPVVCREEIVLPQFAPASGPRTDSGLVPAPHLLR